MLRPRRREVAERSLVVWLRLWQLLATEACELSRWRLVLSQRALDSPLSLKCTLLFAMLLSLLLVDGGEQESLELGTGVLECFLDFFLISRLAFLFHCPASFDHSF